MALTVRPWAKPVRSPVTVEPLDRTVIPPAMGKSFTVLDRGAQSTSDRVLSMYFEPNTVFENQPIQ